MYDSVTREGITVTAKDSGGTYIIACTVTGIPAGEAGVPLHVRAFSQKGTVTAFTPVWTVTVAGLQDL